MRLSRRSEPFDSDDFIYELKVDGFRAPAHIEAGRGELISRNGNVFRGFADRAPWLASHIKVQSAVLDGEIASVPGFTFPKRPCIFVAFDLLFLNGKDLRMRAAPGAKGDAEEAVEAEALPPLVSGPC